MPNTAHIGSDSEDEQGFERDVYGRDVSDVSDMIEGDFTVSLAHIKIRSGLILDCYIDTLVTSRYSRTISRSLVGVIYATMVFPLAQSRMTIWSSRLAFTNLYFVRVIDVQFPLVRVGRYMFIVVRF
jgi:hypothetical protein